VESEVEWGTKFECEILGGHETMICGLSGLDDVGGNLGMETQLNVIDFRLK
jgi:hypothetical protein